MSPYNHPIETGRAIGLSVAAIAPATAAATLTPAAGIARRAG